MKNLKSVVIVLISFFVTLIMTACELVKYVEPESNPTITENEEGLSLDDAKNKYLVEMLNVVSLEDYDEVGKRECLEYIVEARTRINESDNYDEIINTYNEYKDLILSINNADENKLLNHRIEARKIIETYIDISLYRQKEKETIYNEQSYYLHKLNNAKTISEIDSCVNNYKISVYPLLTEADIIAIEYNNAIDDAIDFINSYLNQDYYRSEEVLLIQQIISAFKSEVHLCKTIDDINALKNDYILDLDEIKSEKELYKAECLELIETQYNALLSLLASESIQEDKANEIIGRFNLEKSQMEQMDSKQQIISCITDIKLSIYEENAIIGEEDSFNKYRTLLVEKLYYILTPSDYRELQQLEIKDAIKQKGDQILDCSTYDTLMDCYADACVVLDGILTNDELWEEEDVEFLNIIQSQYGDSALPLPKSLVEANSYEELANIIDYYAFYLLPNGEFLRDSFRVKLNWAYKDADYERIEVYWYCELIRFAVGLDCHIEGEYFVFELLPYNYASIILEGDLSSKVNTLCEYNNQNNLEDRDSSFDDFGYKNVTTKEVTVWNSQQLWYALEKGYAPICVSGSSAELVFNAAKTILRNVIKEGMTDVQKIFEIYKWCGTNWEHDVVFDSKDYSTNYDLYPDSGYALVTSSHAEGGILYNSVVCSAAAKAFLILLRIEGIEAIRVLEFNHKLLDNHTINGHNYNTNGTHETVYINIDGLWYYSDPLFATQFEVTNSFSRLFMPISWAPWQTKHEYDFEACKSLNLSLYEDIMYDGHSIVVHNEDEMAMLMDAFAQYDNTLGQRVLNIIFYAKEFDAYQYYIEHYSYVFKYQEYYSVGELAVFSNNN